MYHFGDLDTNVAMVDCSSDNTAMPEISILDVDPEGADN
jgi:hypothetical protein